MKQDKRPEKQRQRQIDHLEAKLRINVKGLSQIKFQYHFLFLIYT